MATTDQQLSNLIDALRKTASELKTTENGFNQLNNAIAQLGGIDKASSQLKTYEAALLQVAEARKILSSSGTNINTTGLDAATVKLREYIGLLERAGTRQPITPATKPLTWQEQDALNRQNRQVQLLGSDISRRNPGLNGEDLAKQTVAQYEKFIQMQQSQGMTFGKFRKLENTTEAAANTEQNALLQQEISERRKQVAEEKKITLLKGRAAENEQKRLLQEDSDIQSTYNRYKVSPDSARMQREAAQEVSAEQSRQIAETQRAEAATRAQAEARAAQNKLQGAGTTSAFSSVLGGTNTAELEKFNQLLGKYGMSMQNITGISKEMSTGVSQISFAMKDANGVMQQGSIHVDRFGRMLQDTSGKFKGFGDMIARNITKVLEWAISIGIVYGAMAKVSEAVDAMQKLQTVMVEIGITTGQTNTQLQGMFDAVKDIADVTASDFATGIESLNVALRATSGIEDQAQRSAAALILLKDAMTLSKLAGIENAQAMDNLVASLKQMEMPLTSGAILLDKWQAVSQASNTSMEDLSSTFAITAGAASDVGVNIDQLNGLIGAFSEATTLSATETGNALRAMFSNFTQPAAVETFNKYGIAVKNVNGTFRDFIDVFKQVSELSRSGLLNDRQIAELANAMGGGSRRQAQVTALLTVQPRSEELANTSQYDSAGKAQTALALKTETLKSAMERLQNAFDNAANSLGGEGGFLGLMTAIVNILTTGINAVNDITRALGPATTALIGYGLAWAALNQYGPKIQEKLVGTAFAGLNNIGVKQETKMVDGFLTTTQSTTMGRNIAGAMIPVLLMGISQIGQGNTAAGIGTAIGGGFAAVLTGNPMWAIVGGTVGQVIGSAIEQAGKQAADYWATITKTPTQLSGNETYDELTKKIKEAQDSFLKLSGTSAFEGTNKTLGDRIVRTGSNVGAVLGIEGFSPAEQLKKAVEIYRQNDKIFNPSRNLGFTEEEIQKADQWLAIVEQGVSALDKAPRTAQEISTSLYSGAKAFQDLNKDFDINYAKTKQYKQIQGLMAGDVSKGDYRTQVSNTIPGSSTAATNVMLGLYPALRTATEEGIKPYNEEWRKLKDLLATASVESLSFLSATSSNLLQLNDELDKTNALIAILTATGQQGPVLDELLVKQKQITSEVALTKAENLALLEVLKQETAEKFKFLGFTDNRDFNNKEIEQIHQRALALQEAYGAQLKIPQSTLNDFAANNPFIVLSKDGTFNQLNDVIKQFWDTAIQDTQKAAKEMENAFQFQNLKNVDISQKAKLQQAMNYYTNLLKKWGFNDKNELITVLFKDNQVGQLVGSQTALQLALEDLTEVTKKQLDGVYNLPSGATAFIPVQAGQKLANYTENTKDQWKQDYGQTPLTPPLVGSYPNGNPNNTPITPAPEFDFRNSYKPSGEFVRPVPEQSILEKYFKTFEPKKIEPAPSNSLSILQDLLSKLTPVFSTLGRSLSLLMSNQQGNTLPNLPDAFKGTRSAGEAIKVNIVPTKVEAQYNTTTNIRLDGRLIWSAMKQYAFEDFVKFTASVGSSRASTNVL